MTIQAMYTLVQVIPDRLRDERINIAIILQCPETGFSRMRVRTHMGGILNHVFPNIDAETIRLLTQGFSKKFSPISIDQSAEPLFPEGLKIDSQPFEPTFINGLRHDYGIINFSEPRPLVMVEGQSLDVKLDQLYEKLVNSPPKRHQPLNVTKEILESQVVRELHVRRIDLINKPPSFQGLVWPNKFDALRIKTNRRHVQFISFDLTEFPSHHAKILLASVQDLRQAADNEYRDDEFACVLQPPRAQSGLIKDYRSTIQTFQKAGIVTFENQADEITRLAIGLDNDDGLRSVAA
jgi:hypothetical protein